jgi:hypothetical protein
MSSTMSFGPPGVPPPPPPLPTTPPILPEKSSGPNKLKYSKQSNVEHRIQKLNK